MARVSFPKITIISVIFSKEMAANSALYIARRHRKQRKFTSQLPNKGTFLASSFAVQGGGRGGEGSDAQIYLV